MMRKIFLIIVLFFADVSLGKVELNVDVFWGWGGCCRPMEWVPVEVGITSSTTEPFAGTVFISAPQDGLNTMNIQHSFVFTPGLPVQIPLVTKLAFNASKADIRIVGEKGIRWSSSADLWDFSQQNPSLTIVGENDILIGVIGFRKFSLVTLPNETVSRSTRDYGLVYVKDKLPRLSPWDWTAFTSLDLLILYDPDWSLFNEQQLKAIKQWVSNGGKLLIILGNYRLQPNNPLLPLLPFEIQPARQITLTPEILNQLNLNPVNDANAVCSLLTAKPDVNFVQMAVDSNQGGLFGKGRIGFGRVGVLAFDPSFLGENQNSSSTKFWVKIMKSIIDDDNTIDAQMAQARQRGGSFSASSQRETFTRSILVKDEQIKRQVDSNPLNMQMRNNPYNYTIGTAQAGNNAIMEYLYHISQLRPLSIWWVILLLVLFALLLGPVDYMVLKRLDKLPLTWITCCCWIVVFSAGAYYGVAAIRGGSTALRVVSVIDGIEGSGSAWATYYTGMFAPNSADFKLENLSDNQWWSGLAPSEEQLYAYNRQVIGRNIFFNQIDGKNHPTSVPISIWTMQCLLAEWPIEQMPADALVTINGDRATVKINNKSKKRILNGYVLFSNDRTFQFGVIEAASSKEFSGSSVNFTGWMTNSPDRYYQNTYSPGATFSFNKDNAFYAQGTLARTTAIKAMLREGAAVVCLEYGNSDVPFKIQKRFYTTEHIQLVRLVVMPKTES